jgi:hypothetical protein
MIPEAKFEEITDEGLIITTSEGKKMTLKADSIVPVMPLKKNEDLYDSLQGKVPEVYKVGACNDPAALIKDAVAEGAKVANAI